MLLCTSCCAKGNLQQDRCVAEDAMKKTMVMFLALQGAWIPAFGDSREQIVPLRNWALVEKLDPGRMIELSGKSGSKLQGRFVRLDSRAICMSSEGRDLEYPRADVAEVYALIRDTSKDGALRGLVIGVAVSLPLSLAAGSGGGIDKSDVPAFFVSGAVLCGAIGTLVGYLGDRHAPDRKLLYRSR